MRALTLKLYLIAVLVFAAAAHAQQTSPSPSPANLQTAVKTFQLDSKLMGRQVPYNVVLPVSYETDKQARFPVVYLLHGMSGSYRTFSTAPRLLEDFARRQIIIVAVEGGTSFYTDSAASPNDKYESYFIQELIPEIDKNFRTVAEHKGRVVAGVSMGGYGALKYGIKYPNMFALAASMSGAVNVASWRKTSELPDRPALVKALTSAFGDGTDPSRLTANDLFKLFSDIPPDKISDLPFIYLDCATEDELLLLKPNQQLAEVLLNRKIRHEYRQMPGGHSVPAYRIADVLNLSERILREQKTGATSK